MKPVMSVYLQTFYLGLGIGSLPSLFSCCFLSHAERNRSLSLTPTALVLAQSRKLPRPTGTPTPTSLWTASSPQLHPHSPTNSSAACTGCCPIPTRPFGKQWDITEHIPIAQSTSTAGEELGATSYTATAGMCHVVHLSATCQWLFTGWFKQTF